MAFLSRQGTPFFVILSLSGTCAWLFWVAQNLDIARHIWYYSLVCSRAFSSTRDLLVNIKRGVSGCVMPLL